MIRLYWRRKREPNDELKDRVQQAQEQRRAIAAERPKVESLAGRLRKHLQENHFGERLTQQLIASRRGT